MMGASPIRKTLCNACLLCFPLSSVWPDVFPYGFPPVCAADGAGMSSRAKSKNNKTDLLTHMAAVPFDLPVEL